MDRERDRGRVTRRTFLRGLAALTIATASAPLLDACNKVLPAEAPAPTSPSPTEISTTSTFEPPTPPPLTPTETATPTPEAIGGAEDPEVLEHFRYRAMLAKAGSEQKLLEQNGIKTLLDPVAYPVRDPNSGKLVDVYTSYVLRDEKDIKKIWSLSYKTQEGKTTAYPISLTPEEGSEFKPGFSISFTSKGETQINPEVWVVKYEGVETKIVGRVDENFKPQNFEHEVSDGIGKEGVLVLYYNYDKTYSVEAKPTMTPIPTPEAVRIPEDLIKVNHTYVGYNSEIGSKGSALLLYRLPNQFDGDDLGSYYIFFEFHPPETPRRNAFYEFVGARFQEKDGVYVQIPQDLWWGGPKGSVIKLEADPDSGKIKAKLTISPYGVNANLGSINYPRYAGKVLEFKLKDEGEGLNPLLDQLIDIWCKVGGACGYMNREKMLKFLSQRRDDQGRMIRLP